MSSFSRLRPFHPGAPVVALHCSASSPRQWHAYRELLDPQVAFHTPRMLGYGQDEAEWVKGRPVTLEQEAAHVLPALRAAPQPVHLVAHSYGGAVALQVALLCPELVRSLTLYEPCAFHLLAADAGSQQQAEEIRAIAWRVALRSLSGRRDEAGALFVDYWSGPGTWQAMAAPRRADVAIRMSKVRAEFEAALHSRMDVGALQRSGLPVRIYHGDRSPAPVRRIAALLRQRLPDAEVVALPGLRHMAPLTHRDALAPLLFDHSLARAERLAA